MLDDIPPILSYAPNRPGGPWRRVPGFGLLVTATVLVIIPWIFLALAAYLNSILVSRQYLEGPSQGPFFLVLAIVIAGTVIGVPGVILGIVALVKMRNRRWLALIPIVLYLAYWLTLVLVVRAALDL
jgi:hypothetical protein